MYIYEAKGLDIEGTKGNGIIITPEKDGQDPFTPAKAGDTCVLLVPYYDEEGNASCVASFEDYTVAYSEDASPTINEGYKVFAFQGEVTGQFDGGFGKLRGVIFKSITDQTQMTPTVQEGEIVFMIADEADEGEGYQHLETPIKSQVVSASNPSIKVDKPEVSVAVSGETSVSYETIPHVSDSEIEVTIDDDTVCSVTLDKGSAKIEGLKAGSATVTLTITVNDEEYSATISVTVTA